MKTKKLNSLISNFLTFVMLFSSGVNTYVFAAGANGDDSVTETLTAVVEMLLVIAGLVCVGKLIQIGITYMTSSAVEKSNAKAALIPWLVGTVVSFGAAIIGRTILNIIVSDELRSKNVLDY